MKTLNLHNFGQFTILGYGYLAETANDGRAVFCNTLKEAREKVYTSSRFTGSIEKGFVININSPLGGDYGHICADSLEGCLEEHFRILSENGYGIGEV